MADDPWEEQPEAAEEQGLTAETPALVPEGEDAFRALRVSGMYQNWFLDYASYVILERAVPEVVDGLKPVQRRILHGMKDLDDGRFNKVANIIGHTMQYHPHGDASIGEALVQLGQKDLLIETQGNWGNILTGDSSAAPRYIEARLSKFALDVLFNPKTTQWKLSYDGRKKEPITLPAKYPLLLAQGVEGIAVGLSSKILPHNFLELIDASVAILGEKDFEIFPDFPTGGLIDVSRYNDGSRGGKVRIRARIKKLDNKTLVVTELPFGVTTTGLIDTVLLANDKKKIRIRKIDDNTASEVEILIHLQPGVSPDQTIDALYAFTACELSVSPNACVIMDGKPQFLDVKEILRINTRNTLQLLKRELEIRLDELTEQWHSASLERLFIEHKIYRKIETCTTWESVLETIEKGLLPYRKQLKRDVTQEDILRLTEIKIKRISRYDAFKADEEIASIEAEIEEVKNHLAHLVEYAVNFFNQIRKKYARGRERKTEIRNFDVIEAAMVAAASQKLYINRTEGFAGTGLKKDEYLCDCSDIDDIIVIRADGTFFVRKVDQKFFVGKDAIHVAVFKRNDERTIYNLIYRDGKKGKYYVKRFPVQGITRDKEYHLTKGTEGSKIMYLSINPNGEAESVKVLLRPRPRMKKTSFEFDFSGVEIRGRSSLGNILTKYPIRQVVQKEEGVSTLGARDIWFDTSVMRLNADQRGDYLGAFEGEDKIFAIYASGNYRLYNYDLSTHFEDDLIHISRFDPGMVVTAVYIDGNTQTHYIKRFTIEPSGQAVGFLGENKDSRLVILSVDPKPVLEILFQETDGRKREDLVIQAEEFISVKSFRARGKRLSTHAIAAVQLLEPLPVPGLDEEEPLVDSMEAEEEEIIDDGLQQKGKFPEPEQEPFQDPEPPSNGQPASGPDKTGIQITLDFDE